MLSPDSQRHPLCAFFLPGYLSRKIDHTNFPGDRDEAVLGRYEHLLGEALKVLGIPKESLKAKTEFNFDSGDTGKLEAGIAMLRVVNDLHLMGHTNVQLLKPRKGRKGADIMSEKAGKRICLEVKALTKSATGGFGKFLEQQLYDKLFDLITGAKTQLTESAKELECDLKMVAFVVNWFPQSIYLGESDYFQIVKGLASEHDNKALGGIDGILFITSTGQRYLFLEDGAKCIDC